MSNRSKGSQTKGCNLLEEDKNKLGGRAHANPPVGWRCGGGLGPSSRRRWSSTRRRCSSARTTRRRWTSWPSSASAWAASMPPIGCVSQTWNGCRCVREGPPGGGGQGPHGTGEVRSGLQVLEMDNSMKWYEPHCSGHNLMIRLSEIPALFPGSCPLGSFLKF